MYRALFFVPFFAIGCASPTTGEYIFTSSNLVTDCPTSEDTGGSTDENEPVGVKVNDDGTEVVIAGGDPCPLDGNTYTCTSSVETDMNPTYAAVITSTFNSTGTWVSSSKISGTGDYATACEGEGCATLEKYGSVFCSATYDFEAELQD